MIDQWVDWGDYTVTIDPVRNAHWVYEQDGERHQTTMARGKAYDAADTRHLMKLLSEETFSAPEVFRPTVAQLEGMPKFQSRRNGGCDTWRGSIRDVRDVGNLPVVMQKHRDDAFPEEDKGQIAWQHYTDRHHIQDRVLSRDGVPDHGVPC